MKHPSPRWLAVAFTVGVAYRAAAAPADDRFPAAPAPHARPDEAAASLARRLAAPQREGAPPTRFTELAGSFRGIGTVVDMETTTFSMNPYGGGYLIADLNLEDGALIQSVRMFYDNDDLSQPLTLSLCLGWNRPDGSVPGFACPWVTAADSFGGNAAIEMLVDASFRSAFDADLDGVRDDVRWLVFVFFPETTPARLRGLRVAWNRQVSPAPGVPTFNDVPPSDSRFSFVEALAASGITAGCGGGAFCPNATLTRGQMAVFLAKTLGLHWSAASP